MSAVAPAPEMGSQGVSALYARRSLGIHYLLLLATVVLLAGGSLFVGAVDLADARLRDVVLSLRGVRVGAAFIAGAALSVGGVIVQSLFKNPLASPSVLGTTAGADIGGKLAIFAFSFASERAGSQLAGSSGAMSRIGAEMLLPLGCVVGAACALSLLLAVRRVSEQIIVLLLTGFLLASLLSSLSGLLTSIAGERPELARALIAFGLGDVSGVGPRRLAMVAPLVLFGLAAALYFSRSLDVLLSGAEEALALGVDVPRVRICCVTWTAVLTAGAVAVGGNVAFVGLIVPHVLRPLFGVEHRRLLPAAALAGGAFLVACDVLSRALPLQSEIPLGVITGLIGAPVFLLLLLRSRQALGHD